MSTRVALVNRWRSKLDEAQQLLVAGSPRLEWLRRTQVRLYRFLLSLYGDGQWQADQHSSCDDAGEESSAAHVRSFAVSEPYCGSPPKSPGQIRAALKSLHAANQGNAPRAGAVDLNQNPTWLIVATQRDRYRPDKCVKLLHTCGIEARKTRRGRDVAVEVPRDDFDKALSLLRQDPYRDQESVRTKVRKGWRYFVANASLAALVFSFVITSLTAVFLVESGTYSFPDDFFLALRILIGTFAISAASGAVLGWITLLIGRD